MAEVTVGALTEGVRDAASACQKAVDLLKHHTPRPFQVCKEGNMGMPLRAFPCVVACKCVSVC